MFVWTAALLNSVKASIANLTIRGISVLDGEVYVLRVGHKTTDIAVYDVQTLTLQRRLNVDKLTVAHDIASCARRSVIYISDQVNDSIHRVNRDGISIMFGVDDKPAGLSVTGSTGSVLVTCFIRNVVKEFTPVGYLIRTIALQSDVSFPWHCVECLRAGDDDTNYVVCHGNCREETMHRVCLIAGKDGSVQVRNNASSTKVLMCWLECILYCRSRWIRVIVKADRWHFLRATCKHV